MTCHRRHLVITGTASGIGAATADAAAAAGYHVFAGRRGRPEDVDDETTVGAGLLTALRLDVTDAEQIAAAADLVAEHVGVRGIDGLVNVAGIGVSAPLETVSLDQLRRQYDVNVFGQLAVTQSFLPLIRQCRGRVVFIGSVGDRLTVPFAGPLTSSKYAVAAISDTLRLELAPWGIAVILVEPASISTAAVDKLERDAQAVIDGFSPEARDMYADTYRGVIRKALEQERAGSPPAVVAECIMSALSATRPRPHYLVGKDAHLLATVARLPARAQDTLKRRLFGLPGRGSA